MERMENDDNDCDQTWKSDSHDQYFQILQIKLHLCLSLPHILFFVENLVTDRLGKDMVLPKLNIYVCMCPI